MLRITGVEGYEWPLKVDCEDCGISFVAESPNDFELDLDWEFIDNYEEKSEEDKFKTIQLIKVITTYYVKCPICGNEYVISENEIPPTIRSQIPYLTEYFFS